MVRSPWGGVHLTPDEPESDSSSDNDDETYYNWDSNVVVRCRGWGNHGCANSALIKHGRVRCIVCTRNKKDAVKEQKAAVAATWAIWKKFGGELSPEPEYTLVEESDPQDENFIFKEGGESFTGTEAVAAAVEVARVLALNREVGFEAECGLEDCDVIANTFRRLADIAELPSKTRKAASVLGGVTAWPPIIPGKAGRSKIGHVDSYVEFHFVYRLWEETRLLERKRSEKMVSTRQIEQVRALLKDANGDDAKTVCNAALAAACVAHIKEKKLCSLDPGCLTWHHFRGGCWATGNFPTWQ